MNKHFVMTNDADTFLWDNMTQTESIVRFVLSAALIGVIFLDPHMSFKILCVVPALYLFTTALLRWDPVVALLKQLHSGPATQKSADNLMSSRMVDVDQGNASRAVNDPSQSESSQSEYSTGRKAM
jgi:hypothetical protein